MAIETEKHTPGPWTWRIDGTNTGRGPVIYTEGEYYDDGAPREIAELETSETNPSRKRWRRGRYAGQIEANARLIAVAPELLALAESLAGPMPDYSCLRQLAHQLIDKSTTEKTRAK